MHVISQDNSEAQCMTTPDRWGNVLKKVEGTQCLHVAQGGSVSKSMNIGLLKFNDDEIKG